MSETDLKGEIAEQAISLQLVENNFTVFRPLGKDTAIDLIAFDKENKKLYKLQCKYITPVNSTLTVKSTLYNRSNDISYKYDITLIDYIVVYNPVNKQKYYIPISLFDAKNTLALRLTFPENNQMLGITFAGDYLNILERSSEEERQVDSLNVDSSILSVPTKDLYIKKLTPVSCPYCNKGFKNWVGVRNHCGSCELKDNTFYIHEHYGPLSITEFNNKSWFSIKEKYPLLTSRVNVITNFKRKNLECIIL